MSRPVRRVGVGPSRRGIGWVMPGDARWVEAWLAWPVRHGRVMSGEARFRSVRLAGPAWRGPASVWQDWRAKVRLERLGRLGLARIAWWCGSVWAKVRHGGPVRRGME